MLAPSLRRSSLLVTSALAGVVTLTAPAPEARAQSSTPGFAIEEIVVTSRRREESLQDVPVAVTAFDAETIRRAGIERPQDFIALTPNVSFIQTTNVGESQVHIRGIIQPRDTEPPFAYVVDGVLVPNPNAFNAELIDIEQIEVIKGPQGAIYGRNAIGGAILVNTKKPGNEVEAEAELSYEFEGEEISGSGFVSFPVVEDLAFARLTVSHTNRDGYYRNLTLEEPEDPFEETQIRGRFVLQPSETVEIDIRAGAGEIDGHAINFNAQVQGTPGFETGVDINDTSVPFVGNVRSFNEQTRREISARVDWETQIGTVTGTLAYNLLEESLGGEGAADLALFGIIPPPPAPGDFFTDPSLFEGYGPTPRDGTQYQERNQEDWSAEIRLTSPGENRLRYLVGAYFANIDRDVLGNNGIDTGNGLIVRNPINGPTSLNPTATLLWSSNDNQAYAVFGQLSYDVTDSIELSAALRWDYEDRENTNLVPASLSGNPNSLGLVREQTFEDLQPILAARWNVTEEVSVYASYGEGFRSGGFNPLGSRQAIITVDQLVNTTVQDEFDKETSRSYELGLKSQFLDNRVRFNAAGFYTEVEDAHYFQFFPLSLARVISIIDEVEIWGFEAEASAGLTQGLEVFGSFGWIDSEIQANAEDPQSVGNDMPYTADYTLALGAQYIAPLTDRIDFVGRIDYTREGEMWFDTLNTPGTQRDPVDLVNLRLGVEDENWSLTFFGRNIFDEEYNADGVVLINPFIGAFNFVTKGAPATYGLELGYRF